MDDIVSIDNSLLISLVEKYPVLWDRSLDFYKNRAATQAAWNQVTKTLKPEYTTWDDANRKAYDKVIKQRWTHIRDNYYRSYKKIQEHQYYGTKPTKPYIYSKKLSFLEKILPKYVPSLTSEVDIKTEIEIYPESIGVSENSLEAHDMSAMNPTVEVIPTYSENLNDPIASQEPPESNRHLLFFKGILPSLENFDDNETIDFQMGVLKLLKKIKSGQQNERMSYNIKFEDTSSSHSSGQ